MGREAQKKREEEAEAAKPKGRELTPEEREIKDRAEANGDGEETQTQQVQFDPAMLSMLAAPGMTAMEDRRYMVQTLAVGKKDQNGLREITFPVSATKSITMVLAEDLQEHLRKQLSGGLDIADLSEIATEAERARKAEAAEGELKA